MLKTIKELERLYAQFEDQQKYCQSLFLKMLAEFRDFDRRRKRALHSAVNTDIWEIIKGKDLHPLWVVLWDKFEASTIIELTDEQREQLVPLLREAYKDS